MAPVDIPVCDPEKRRARIIYKESKLIRAVQPFVSKKLKFEGS
jgi:hypothetical protein